MDAPVPETLPKKEFAELIGVSAGRVSQYISEGKLTGEALDGEGRRARIRVQTALAQLRMKLDVGQMMGNGLGTRLKAPVAPTHPGGSELPLQEGPPPRLSWQTPGDQGPTIEDQLKQEKLLQARITSRKASEEEEKRKGRFTETAEVKAEMVRLATRLLDTFEGSLPDFANAIAEKFEVPARDVLHVMRAEFRTVRAKEAMKAKDRAQKEAETIASNIEASEER